MKSRSKRRRGPGSEASDGARRSPTGATGGAKGPLEPLRLLTGLTVLLGGLALLPRVQSNPWLAGSFWGAAAVLLLLQLALRWQIARSGRTLSWEFVPLPVHWVQAVLQACLYVYWGSYWPEVGSHVPLIAAQLVFLYGLDLSLGWFRRDRWVLGFGPVPIVFATNLFMWFRDEWFFLQFAMVATGVLGKHFIRWTRDGRDTHVFNPSTFALFLFSLGLIATESTDITWGQEIAATLGLPPNIYFVVFLVGLVVQFRFSVTLVTLSAGLALYGLNLAYTGVTGTYNFIITNIPIAVFLGFHLLVTDPSTSPKSNLGRVVFGGAYGVLSFALFGVLDRYGAPTFYDKLLCVPVLNLTVRWLDRMSAFVEEKVETLARASAWSGLNSAAMATWVALFALMTATGFFAREHPGRNPDFWRDACRAERPGACRTWVSLLEFFCDRESAKACQTLGALASEGRVMERDAPGAGKKWARACNLGLDDGCDTLAAFVRNGGQATLETACTEGDGESCFVLGEIRHYGVGVRRDDTAAASLFRRSCDTGWSRGCGRLGESYLHGQGIPADPVKAIESFEKACEAGDPAGCAAVGLVYRRDIPGLADDRLAARWMSQACRLGMGSACEEGETPGGPDPATAFEAELLEFGG